MTTAKLSPIALALIGASALAVSAVAQAPAAPPTAGATGLGVFEAARETGKLVIGTDADQYAEAPGHVLTSMVKHVDVATFDVIQHFGGGVHETVERHVKLAHGREDAGDAAGGFVGRRDFHFLGIDETGEGGNLLCRPWKAV